MNTGFFGRNSFADAILDMQRSYIDMFTQAAFMPVRVMTALPSLPSAPSLSRSLVRTPQKVVEKTEGILPVAEEYLQIGKRVEHGETTRVVRDVVETPVEEQVELLTNTVVVERRKPTESSTLHDALSHGEITLTTTRERPVVSKGVRLVEEVVLRNETTAHVETIRDTLRRDKIEVIQPNHLPAIVPHEKKSDDFKKSQARQNHG